MPCAPCLCRAPISLATALALAVIHFAGAPAPATAQTWTGTASGSWANGSNWSSPPAGGVNTQLTFGATANPVMTDDIAGPFVLNKLTFTVAAPVYAVVGSQLDFRTNGGSAPPAIAMNSANAVTVADAVTLTNSLTVTGTGTGGLTLNGAIAGAGSLTYAGGGTLTLGNAANTYGGGTAVTSGTLALGTGTAIPTGGTVTVGAGAQFNLAGLNNAAGTAVGVVTLASGTLRASAGADYHLNQLVMTDGTVDFTGSSNMRLHLRNSGAGITINPGTSTWTGAGASRIQNDTAGPLTITVNGGGLLNAGIILSAAGANANFTKAGDGAVRLTNTGNTANITLTRGYLVTNDLAANTGLGPFGTLGTGAITLSGGTLYYDGPTASSAKPFTLTPQGGFVQLANGGTNLTLSGVLGESAAGAGLSVFAPGTSPATLTLTGTNTYTGATGTASQGVIAVPTIANGGAPSPIGASSNAAGNLILGTSGFGRGTLLLTGTNPSYGTDRGVTVSGPYAANDGGAVGVQNAGTTLTWSGPVTGGGSFIKTGGGTLVLGNAANNYSGGTVVEAGRLVLGAATALPTGGAVTVLGGTLDLNTFSPSVGSLTGAAGSLVSLGAATLTVGADHTSTAFAGTLSGGTLVKTGFGTLTLSGTGNTANLTVGGGMIRVDDVTTGGAGALGSGTLTLTGGTFLYGGPTAASAKPMTLGAGGGGVWVPAAGTGLTLSGAVGESVAGQKLTVSGSGGALPASILTLTGVSTYAGATIVTFDGVLSVGTFANGGVASPLGTSSAAPANLVLGDSSGNVGTLQYVGSTTATDRGLTLFTPGFFFPPRTNTIEVGNAATTLTIAGQVTGGGGLTKAGPGTLTLTNSANNYGSSAFTGTVVNAGRLVLGDFVAALPANSRVTVAGGAELVTGNSNGFTPDNVTTVTLNGGALRVANYFSLNKLVTGGAGGTVRANGSSAIGLYFANSGAGITINGDSTLTGPTGSSLQLANGTGPLPITIAPNATFTSDFYLFGVLVTGGGTLYQKSTALLVSGITVSQAKLRVDDVSTNGSGALGYSAVTLDGGTIQYAGPTAALNLVNSFGPGLVFAAGGGTIEVVNASTALTLSGPASGPGPLTKAGPGVLVLANAANLYPGGIAVAAGRLEVATDAQLGLANPTVSAPGTLRYTASSSTSRTFNLVGGSLEAPAGVTLTLNGATVGGGFLRGAGTFALTGGTTLAGGTTINNTTINAIGAASLTTFSNSGPLAVTAGPATPVTLNGFINQGSGAVAVGAGSRVNAAEFQSYGTITVAPGPSFAGRTQLTNTGTSQWYFNGGSRTFVGTPATAATPTAAIDLNGQNAVVAGGLFVNNGIVLDNSTGDFLGPARLVADYGALIRGAGAYLNTPVTQNGGRFQAGNSPGRATHGSLVVGAGGIKSDTFQINNASGAGGPTADGTGNVSGWTMHNVVTQIGSIATPGDFAWTADASNKGTITLQTLLDPTPVGSDNFGLMANFDPARDYSWPFVSWGGTYAGPTSDAGLVAATMFDTTGFLNPTNGGTFGWHLDVPGQTLSLTFTAAVPEPCTLALTAAAGLAAAWRGRRRRQGS